MDGDSPKGLESDQGQGRAWSSTRAVPGMLRRGHAGARPVTAAGLGLGSKGAAPDGP